MNNTMMVDVLMLLGQVEIHNILDAESKAYWFMQHMSDLFSERFTIFEA